MSLLVTDQRLLPRETVRQVACPRCGVRPGFNCRGVRGGARVSNHIERVEVALEMSR